MKLLILVTLCGVALSAHYVDVRQNTVVCYFKGRKIAIDEELRPRGDCIKASCKQEGNGTLLALETCGKVLFDVPEMKADGTSWKVVRDKSARYPDCCPKQVQVSESDNLLKSNSFIPEFT